jgi:hypothetical protein
MRGRDVNMRHRSRDNPSRGWLRGDGQWSIAMSATATPFPVIREAVASFPDREHFRRAVANLLAAGFAPSDLSVLAAHAPLSAAEEKPGELIAAGLSDEIKYIGPLTIAGIILLSGGPIAATVAALVGAGLGGAALKELIDDYTAVPHRAQFAAALEAGAALLWVRCGDPELELRALRILEESGGRHVHIHGRPTQAADAG